jgi:CheY-like chemotaxis protein
MNDRSHFPEPEPGGAVADRAPRRVLLCDIEPAMAALFAEWLGADGLQADADASRPEPPAALILIELPFPRQGGTLRLRELAGAWPGVPLIVLSPTLLPGVSPQGEVARALGAAAVLPAPVSRAALRAAVARVLPP